MNQISTPKEKTATFNYQGNAGAYTLLYFKVIIFSIISFGLYYPWAKVAILKYHYKATSFGDTNFTFHGTGKEVFRGFLKIYFPTLVLYAFLIYASVNKNSWELSIALALLYAFFIFILPFAIHGAVRYRSSKSSWKGIRFSYLGNRTEFFGFS
ncbi:DUF898 family protein [Tenacibaculum sp. SG-28]|uniref:DUF898 family protein n=1 Tax=Tenacibaculum sp. SG-28 TaxID=754426 RepID=UPI000CF53269|nr:DUF898 family protein [Tenacibaculum sp. SG-28]PQJ20654.1 hypothetical protein BSU00_10140 [Tenacibaculum sp. SG-28]